MATVGVLCECVSDCQCTCGDVRFNTPGKCQTHRSGLFVLLVSNLSASVQVCLAGSRAARSHIWTIWPPTSFQICLPARLEMRSTSSFGVVKVKRSGRRLKAKLKHSELCLAVWLESFSKRQQSHCFQHGNNSRTTPFSMQHAKQLFY